MLIAFGYKQAFILSHYAAGLSIGSSGAMRGLACGESL
jgi:hypothetical protein